MAAALAGYRAGRICLHIAAAVGDREFKWHWAGILREFK